MRILLTSVVLLQATACGGIPTSDVAEFGKVANDTVTLLKDNYVLESELATDASILSNSCRYLRGRHYRLAGSRETDELKLLVDQFKFLNALAKYTTALSEATDPQSVANLRSAASQLSASLTGAISAVPTSSAISAATGPGIKFLINGIVNFSEIRRQRQIREIAQSVDPLLVDALSLINNDAEIIRSTILERVEHWESAARCNLNRMRGNKAQAFVRFRDIDGTLRGYRARISTLDKGVASMAALVAAHNALANANEDFGASIATINQTLGDVSALQTALLSE